MSINELQSLAETGDAVAQKYVDLSIKQDELRQKQEELAKEQEEKNPEEDEVEALQNSIDAIAEEAGALQTEIDAITAAAKDSNKAIEEFKVLLGSVPISEIVDDMTKLNSAMERVQESIGNTNLALKEQIELLSEYPELLGAMERGYLTMSEAVQFSEEQLAKSRDEMTKSMNNFGITYDTGTVTMTGMSE
jgi:chromosome segregation ATPase